MDYTKPSDIDILWAQNGDITRPSTSKIQQGWVVEAPDRQFFNWLDNKQDAYIAYINQKGIPEWDVASQYIGVKSHVVGSDGIIYRALRNNVGQNPLTSPLDWVRVTDPAGFSYSTTVSDSRYLQKTSNLSDLANTATARTNLDVFSKAESDSRFVNVTGSESMAGPLTVTGGVVANLTGNASTAASLQTARNINLSGEVSGSASFNGASDVTINATVNANAKYYPRAEADAKFVDAAGDTMTGALTVPVTPTASGHATAKQYVDNLFSLAVPSGAVIAFARNTAPSGWLICDGSGVSRTTYAALFAAIGTTFGAGNGTTTFNLPDLRAEFIRGWDAGRGVDGGRAFGSTQDSQNKAHTHLIANNQNVFAPRNTLLANTVLGNLGGTGGESAYHLGGLNPDVYPPNSGITSTEGGSEARSRNVAMLYCIKF